ncbi:MAG TPA: PorV/PorQ family protein [Bacteroidia bacterium]|jgi:hypothetical protein|nr:PorV/PorQ family protein [Bacteroidia bacterium]HRG53825.1 PorV/PorQ family protein [Bacteroidia bacterium]
MKHNYKIAAIILGCIFFSLHTSFAGNPDRAGQSGATELLINPWARSNGFAGSNIAGARGIESAFTNCSGIAFTKKTELIFSHQLYLQGTGIKLNSLGLSQHVGETGAIGIAVTSMDFGDIDITTDEYPDAGKLGKYSPQFLNIAFGYSKNFSDDISGGLMVKIITEKISNVSARGVALDAGIQYTAGKQDQMKFGIALKNWGPKMKYQGDGLSFKTPVPASTNGANTMTVEQRSAQFELPALLNIGVGYDIYFEKDTAKLKNNRVTINGAFTSNSFSKDQIKVGLEYSWKNILMVRAGYAFEKGIFSSTDRTNVYTGPSAGFTLEVPFGKNKSSFGIDYAYIASQPFGGTHNLGVRINL